MWSTVAATALLVKGKVKTDFGQDPIKFAHNLLHDALAIVEFNVQDEAIAILLSQWLHFFQPENATNSSRMEASSLFSLRENILDIFTFFLHLVNFFKRLIRKKISRLQAIFEISLNCVIFIICNFLLITITRMLSSYNQ